MRELMIVAACIVIGYCVAGGIARQTTDAITEDRQQCDIDDNYVQEYTASLRPEYRFTASTSIVSQFPEEQAH